MEVRYAKPVDLPAITDIYNQAIEAGFQTAFTVPLTVEEHQPWFQSHPQDVYPILVCEENGSVVGWISISPYRAGRKALQYTVELSYFVDKECQGKGVGSLLIENALVRCCQLNYKTAILIIIDRNEASVKLGRKYGFEQWGFLPGVVEHNGEVANHLYYGRKL